MSRLATAILVAAMGVGACGKDKASEKEPAPETPVAATEEPKETATKPEPPKPDEDYILIEATHAKPKPSDPVVIQLKSYRVTSVSFESPDNLEGATATVEIDVASLESDSKGRDKHLREADYLDTEKFALSTVDISNVKKLDTDSYQAELKVALHGAENTWQVDFIVADKTDESVTIEMQHTFERRSFGIGAEDASPAQDILAKVRLTFAKESLP